MKENNHQNYSAEEWSARKQNEKKELYQMMDAAVSEIAANGSQLAAYLDTQSRLDRYSACNTLLIYRQYPEAVQLKTFDEWAKENVSIRKGSKSISIFEPSDYVKKDGSKTVVYNVKKLFDVGQTKARQPAEQRKPDLRTALSAMLDTAPVEVEAMDELLYSKSRAYYDPQMNKLCIKRNTGDAVLLCQSVAYELGQAQFALADREKYNREEVQFSARCVGYMLCRKFGVDAKAFAVHQIPESWQKKDTKEIKAELGKIRDAMHDIYSRAAQQVYQKSQEYTKPGKEQER